MSIVSGLTAALAANPLLTAGVGGVAFAAASRVLGSLPAAVGRLAVLSCTTSLTVTSRYSLYHDVVGYLGGHVLRCSERSLAPTSRGNEVSIGYGSGLARFGGALVVYQRTLDAASAGYQSETLRLWFLTRDRALPRRFVREALTTDQDRNIRVRVVDTAGGITSERVVTKPRRALATVHADAVVKDRLVSGFRGFLASEAAYAARGIPYRFCAVLHGPPGTGKTSLVHALASDLGLSIVYITSLNGIGQVAASCGRDDLLVIEDIDAMANGLDREADGKVERGEDGTPPLHALLNALDGFCTPHGLKVAVTTNHVDRLDPALLRPGRADLLIEVGPLHDGAIREMFSARYGVQAAALLDHRRLQPAAGAWLQQMFHAHPDADGAAAALGCRGPSLGLVREAAK